MDKINIQSMGEITRNAPKQKTSASHENGFAEKLKESIMEVNQRQQNANQAIEKVVNGEIDIHEGMLKIQEADISMRLLLQVRRKVMDAYTEIMRMQL
ncbi:MAG: flagellar hook-basal body complex protein FliE [Desulfobacterium sp.]|nr:flagellar hook-basal body complex protein FliE [Desulfobacterium sp.]